MTTPLLPDILARADRGESAEAIAAASGLSVGYIYGILRRERPDLPRKRRAATSKVPATVRGMAATGIKAPRIAELLSIKRQYVYRILAEGTQ